MKLNVFACVRQPSQGPTFGIKGEIHVPDPGGPALAKIGWNTFFLQNPVWMFLTIVPFPVCRWCCRRRIFSSHSNGGGTALLFEFKNEFAWKEKFNWTNNFEMFFFLVQPPSHWRHSCYHCCQQLSGCSYWRSHVPWVYTIWQGVIIIIICFWEMH